MLKQVSQVFMTMLLTKRDHYCYNMIRVCARAVGFEAKSQHRNQQDAPPPMWRAELKPSRTSLNLSNAALGRHGASSRLCWWVVRVTRRVLYGE